MFRPVLLAAIGLLCAVCSALAAQKADPPPPARALALMTNYTKGTNIEARLEALRGLEKYRARAIDDFLLAEYGKLDSSKPDGAQLLGGFLRVWATRPNPAVLPFLIYEGLFHDDAEVVRLCASAIADAPEQAKVVISTGTSKSGRDPSEDLAAELIERMAERPDVFVPIEKVLAIWSGKARSGYLPGASLKRKLDEKERTAALAFWKSWFNDRFKKAAGGSKK